ncbi:MAG: hypothetical protein CM1200mP2_10910 [Planctomycetaceae bacterium]|nr:MAG: hypothetical protein CM1200mP2_10910 [Planctomycetaceae bacterium]
MGSWVMTTGEAVFAPGQAVRPRAARVSWGDPGCQGVWRHQRFAGTRRLQQAGVLPDAYKRSQAEIRKCLPLAEDLGIQILIENVWNNFLLSPNETARFVDELKSPLVGVYFESATWSVWMARAVDHDARVRIKKLDIKEYSRKLQNQKGPYAGFGVKIGDGDCDWPGVMKALAEIKFSGWATAEVVAGRGPG